MLICVIRTSCLTVLGLTGPKERRLLSRARQDGGKCFLLKVLGGESDKAASTVSHLIFIRSLQRRECADREVQCVFE